MPPPPGELTPPAQEALDPREFLRLLWRRKWILILCVTLIPAATYLVSSRLPKHYEASTLMQIGASAADQTGPLTADFTAPPAGYSVSIATLIQTSGVTDEAARILHEPKGSLRGAVTAEADEDTSFIKVTAGAGSAERAADIANAVAEAVQTTRKRQGTRRVNAALAGVERDLEAALTPLERQQVREQRQRLIALQQAQANATSVIEPATPPASPISPKPARNAMLAVIFALLLGAALVALAERMDRRLHESSDLEEHSGAPVLATVPGGAFPGGAPDPETPVVFQRLRDGLTYFNVDRSLTSILVMSPLKGEGKTTVVAHLAVAFARAGKRVVALDADLRNPQLGPRMGVERTPGLSEVLMGGDPADALQEIEPFGEGLRVLPGGSMAPNASEMLGSERMSSLVPHLAGMCDLLLIDTAPLLIVSDAYPLLDQVSGILGVARLEQTPREAVRRGIEVASTAGGRVLGMVATDGHERDGYGYGYGYGYAYGYGDGAPEAAAASGNGAPNTQARQAGTGVGRRVNQLFRSG